jgi:hypothetical protein
MKLANKRSKEQEAAIGGECAWDFMARLNRFTGGVPHMPEALAL